MPRLTEEIISALRAQHKTFLEQGPACISTGQRLDSAVIIRLLDEVDTLKNHYEVQVGLAVSYRNERDTLRAELKEALWHEQSSATAETQTREQLEEVVNALELIAVPKRADGTYNRDREACEILAKETLAKIRDKKE